MANGFHIPHEILLDILSRLPVKSITRFKLVDRSWFSLATSHELALRHLHRHRASRATYKHGVIAVEDSHTLHPSLCLHILSGDSQKLVVKQIEKVSEEVKYDPRSFAEVVGSCNGLLLISLKPRFCFNDLTEFVLWNPSTGEHKKIYRRICSDAIIRRHTIAGLGYDDSNDNYKIIVGSTDYISMQHQILVEIYNLKTGCWEEKTYHHFPYWIHEFDFHRGATTLRNGIPHWIARRQTNIERVILSFDPTDDKFKEVTPPPVESEFSDFRSDVYVSALDGKLCLRIILDYTLQLNFLNLWVMEGKYGLEKSWKNLNITLPIPNQPIVSLHPVTSMPIGFGKEGQVVLSSHRRAIVIFDSNSQAYSNILLSGCREVSGVASYVETLLSPNHYHI